MRPSQSRWCCGACTRSGSRSASLIVQRGFNDRYGSWNTYCIRRRTRQHGGAVGPGQDRTDVLPVEADLAGVGAHEIEDAARGGGLAAAALADQAERLAGLQREGDVVHCAHDAGLAPAERAA